MEAYLDSTGPARKVVKYRRGDVVFSQGDPGDDVRYIQKGAIKLSVLSRIGKEAVVAMLGPATFSARAPWPVKRFASGRRRQWSRPAC